MISKSKLDRIRSTVQQFHRMEEIADDEGHDFGSSEEERREEAIFNCAMKLRLQEQTVERHWEKFEEQET